MERKIFETAYLHFLEEREIRKPMDGYPLSYNLCDSIEDGEWKNGIPFINLMVSGELRETINLLNSWCRHLTSWAVWIKVLEKYNEQDSWLIRDHFVESIVFLCMFQSSSTRDRLGAIATNAIHQANLCVDSEYRDRLDQDKNSNIPLPRKKREKQLKHLGQRWKNYGAFEEQLEKMDSKKYRDITRDFRNLASHEIAPRFECGHTKFVTRSIVPKSEMIKLPDGLFQVVNHPKTKAVSYGFGGTPPLSLCEMHEANEKEYILAVSVFNAYQDILTELLNALASTEA